MSYNMCISKYVIRAIKPYAFRQIITFSAKLKKNNNNYNFTILLQGE